jgi:hypothetical protein
MSPLLLLFSMEVVCIMSFAWLLLVWLATLSVYGCAFVVRCTLMCVGTVTLLSWHGLVLLCLCMLCGSSSFIPSLYG